MAPSHHATREVRDAVYGFVKLSEAEWEIVNSSAFERLRDIRQLGLGHLIYPGATHSRFEHSIGTVHLSTLMFDALVERDGDVIESEFGLPASAQQRARQVLRLAALLHDVGHPPFSHSAEKLLPNTASGAGARRLTHEDMTARIIRESDIGSKLHDMFGPQSIDREEVIALATDFRLANKFRPQAYHGFLHDVLTGELGADRVDFLLRDAHHSGQKSGDFDYRRLVGSLRLVPAPEQAEPGSRIGFDAGGWLVAEQMIVARYLMYQSLYFHRTKRIFEIHLEEFLRKWLASRFAREELPADLAEYLGLTDSVVWADLRAAVLDASHALHGHARHFAGRSQMRLAKELIVADNCRSTSSGRRLPITQRFDKLAIDVRIEFGSVIACDQPDHSATQMFDDTHKILVLLDGRTRFLDNISEIVRGMSDKIWRGRVYAEKNVVARVGEWCAEWLSKNPIETFVPSLGQGETHA